MIFNFTDNKTSKTFQTKDLDDIQFNVYSTLLPLYDVFICSIVCVVRNHYLFIECQTAYINVFRNINICSLIPPVAFVTSGQCASQHCIAGVIHIVFYKYLFSFILFSPLLIWQCLSLVQWFPAVYGISMRAKYQGRWPTLPTTIRTDTALRIT